jgi:long-chain acyl-CoA synthetase
LLLTFDLQPGERVAIMAQSCLEWILLDVAVTLMGCVSVPIYPTVTGEEAVFILRDAGCSVAIVADEANWERLVSLPASPTESMWGPGGRADLPESLRGVVLMRGEKDSDSAVSSGHSLPVRVLTGVERLGRDRLEEGSLRQRLRERAWAADLGDPFSIVYTSGTTGRAKGVVISHRNIVYEAWAIRSTIAVDRSDEQLLILPLAHIFARHMVWAAVDSGATTAVGSGLDRIAADLVEVAPTFVGAVPRVYEKIYDRVMRDVAGSGTGRQSVFAWAMDIGRRVSMHRQRRESVPGLLAARMKVADRLVFAEIRRLLGDRLRFFVSGAAPLAREIAEFFHAAGVLILEGYGLTETTGATHVNRPDRFRFGTVGPALPGCEVLIAEDGEVLLRGNNVMEGYHGQPEATAEVIDADGWLHTGDVGELVDGFLRITHRKKAIIITAGGKNIAPLKIERRLGRARGVGHVTVHGDRRPHLVALVELDEEVMLELGREERLGCRSYEDLARHPRIRTIVQGYVDAVNRALASYETIKRFDILPRPLNERDGLLTPTQKVRRGAIEEHYADLIADLYS